MIFIFLARTEPKMLAAAGLNVCQKLVIIKIIEWDHYTEMYEGDSGMDD